MTQITLKGAFGVALIAGLGLAAFSASAQTISGGRQGQNGRGYTYTGTRSGNTVTGSVQTNGGYGATASHSGYTTASGVRTGSSAVTTNNGSSVTTRASGKNGYAAGTVTATGPAGKTATRSGAVYVPR